MQKLNNQTITLTVQSRGQVTLPKRMRAAMNLEPGDTVIAVPEGDGRFRLETLKRMSIDEMIARWGDPTPITVAEVERQIEEARDFHANERAQEYGE